MTPDVARVARWVAEVRADERACTIEQCLDRIDALLTMLTASERKPPSRAVGRAVRDEGRRTGTAR